MFSFIFLKKNYSRENIEGKIKLLSDCDIIVER